MPMDSKEYTRLSKVLAEIIFRAYGKDPAAYDDLEEQVIGAFVFGAHGAFSRLQQIPEWQRKIAMYEVLMDEFGFDYEMAGNALDFFDECQNTIGFNEPLKIDGWKVYLVDYDNERGRWSKIAVFELVRDPWLPFVYIGIFMLLAGAVCMLSLSGGRKTNGKS